MTDVERAAWNKYNYDYCADKGSHDMRLAFIAGYKRALEEAASIGALAGGKWAQDVRNAIESLKQSNSGMEVRK